MGFIYCIDTEWTCWRGSAERNWSGPGEHREIISIGSILLNPNFVEIASLHLFVRPKINPLLSHYCVDLTGIGQAFIDANGIPFPDAVDIFHRFLQLGEGPIFSNGGDETVLRENCALLGVRDPFDTGRFQNARPLLGKAFRVADDDLDSNGLDRFFRDEDDGASSSRGIAPHNALADARKLGSALRVALRFRLARSDV